MDRRQKNITAHLAQKNVLDARRQKLIDSLLDEKTDQDLYSEQMEIIKGKLNDLIEILTIEELSMESQQRDLDLYGLVFSDLHFLWDHAPLELRQALQKAMFPVFTWDITEEEIVVRESSSGLRSTS